MSSDQTDSENRSDLSYEVVSLKSRPDLREEHARLGNAAWPEFMFHDPVLNRNWMVLMEYFPEYQLALLDQGNLLAIVNAVPLKFSDPLEALPDRGLDWGVEQSVSDRERGERSNCLMGIQVVVGKDHRGRSLSRHAVIEMTEVARQTGLQRVILPVRPNHKHRFPLIPMSDYVTWTNDAGLPYDGWLRVHARLGGTIVRICPHSMTIPGTIEEWSAWTGLEFPGDGNYCVPGALTPVEVDHGQDRGVYREPNVWVVHEAG